MAPVHKSINRLAMCLLPIIELSTSLPLSAKNVTQAILTSTRPVDEELGAGNGSYSPPQSTYTHCTDPGGLLNRVGSAAVMRTSVPLSGPKAEIPIQPFWGSFLRFGHLSRGNVTRLGRLWLVMTTKCLMESNCLLVMGSTPSRLLARAKTGTMGRSIALRMPIKSCTLNLRSTS